MNFEEATISFKNDNIRQLAEVPEGLRFLKLQSMSRKDYLQQLFASAELDPTSTKVTDLLRQAFESPRISDEQIDGFIRKAYAEQRVERLNLEPALVSELYKVQVFDWGGLHQNSLERTIVDQYVKKINDYETLSEKVESELHQSMRGYVLCSWYNHWTSTIIEDSFRDHPAVLPAIGQVKKIDFFVNQVPFDLKVTHLPEGYIAEARKQEGLRPELTLLRQAARSLKIGSDPGMSNPRQLQNLWTQLQDHPSPTARALIAELTSFRLQLLDDSRNEPTELIVWLYENQGVRRFDASNRLFLVLVDRNNFFDSWKLKRAKPLLDQQIHAYLDSAGLNPGRQVEFDWEGGKHTVQSDAVFIVNP